jgi:DnaJ-domain-containing protein 1
LSIFRKFSHLFDAPPPREQVTGKPCDHPGCGETGTYRAPKSRHHLESCLNDWLWFCLPHIRAYNAQWNYYANMSEAEIERERRADMTWQRPTWALGDAKLNTPFQDPFDLFTEPPNQRRPPSRESFPPLSAETKALNTLGLSYPFSEENLRKKYRELVKKHHPDANGGSPKSEEAIKRINEAYRLLKGFGGI